MKNGYVNIDLKNYELGAYNDRIVIKGIYDKFKLGKPIILSNFKCIYNDVLYISDTIMITSFVMDSAKTYRAYFTPQFEDGSISLETILYVTVEPNDEIFVEEF